MEDNDDAPINDDACGDPSEVISKYFLRIVEFSQAHLSQVPNNPVLYVVIEQTRQIDKINWKFSIYSPKAKSECIPIMEMTAIATRGLGSLTAVASYDRIYRENSNLPVDGSREVLETATKK